MKELLKEDERIDQLMRYKLEIIQSPSVFSFSLDAILLGEFAAVPRHNRAKIVDLCSGNGVVPLLLSQKTKSPIKAIELQERLADMARRSIRLNQLVDQIDVIQGDVANAYQWIPKDSVDVVTCNPPYFPATEKSVKNPNQHLAIARHELHTNLDEVLSIASGLLKMNGKLYMVHRPDRLLEILDAMRQNRLAPKKIQLVYPKRDREANILLIEGMKDGKEAGFKVLPPVFVYDENNDYLPEVRRLIYGDE